jgi:hypothetical protein
MNIELARKAAGQFMGQGRHLDIEPLGEGLIHFTCKVTDPSENKSIVLQAINSVVFPRPADIVSNYQKVYEYLERNHQPSIPAPITAMDGGLGWVDDTRQFWRAMKFIEGSYSPMTAKNEDDARKVASIFGGFTRALAGMDPSALIAVIPGFHQLTLRYRQLEEAIEKASIERLLKSTHVIAEFRDRRNLVDFFEEILHSPDYPDRVMHHDCKISNILFNKSSGEVICPVDLDTLMPGKFFSDLGDMIRSMCCTVDENSVQWEQIQMYPAFYKAILEGYLEGMGDIFSSEEKENIHYAGLIMIYMQGTRFLADFLDDDIYYKTHYPEQNLNRALNQLILLEKLEAFLEREYAFTPYR